ncbi:MAG TPA: hypothetical protein VMU16_13125 [Candidatus Binataceae bacterium]|nr:hypothetical protein [Candidatus Binataceae bacterium]
MSGAERISATASSRHDKASAALWHIGGDSVPQAILPVILIVGALACGRSLANRFALDDYAQIVNNRLIGQWPFIWRSMVNDERWFADPLHLPQTPYYRPFQNVWFALNYHLFGLNPIGWHTAMIALHLIVVWLVYRVATRLSGDRWAGPLAAGLFALMPIHAEAVAWVASAATLLGAAFEMAAFERYLLAAQSAAAKTRQTFLSLIFFGAALLSYDSAVAFPALVAAHAMIFRQGSSDAPMQRAAGNRVFSVIAIIWPYLAEFAAYLGLRYWVLGFVSRPNAFNSLTPLTVILTIPSAVMQYLALLAIPWQAGPAHTLNIATRASSPDFYVPAIELIVLLASAAILLQEHPHRRLYLFCGAWFFITLGPILRLDLLFIKFMIQDRYLYLPSFGVSLMAADLAIWSARRSDTAAKMVAFASVAIVVAYAALMWTLQPIWRDDAAVFTRAVAAAPKFEFWHQGLASALAAQGDFAGASREYERAAALTPQGGDDIFYGLALAYEHIGNRRGAERAMAERVKRLDHQTSDAYADLALAAMAAGDKPEAEEALKQSEAIPGGSESGAITRAKIFLLDGNATDAERTMRMLLAKTPNDATAIEILGTAFSAEHRDTEALAAFQRALSLEPNKQELHYKIAAALHNLGRNREALAECTVALRTVPGDQTTNALISAIERALPER